MPYREVGIWEILEVLRRVHRGESQVRIARATGHTRKTIRRYTRTARKRGWTPGGTQEPDENIGRKSCVSEVLAESTDVRFSPK